MCWILCCLDLLLLRGFRVYLREVMVYYLVPLRVANSYALALYHPVKIRQPLFVAMAVPPLV